MAVCFLAFGNWVIRRILVDWTAFKESLVDPLISVEKWYFLSLSSSRSFLCLSITSPKTQTAAVKNSPWNLTGGELLRKLHLSWEKCVHMWAIRWKCLHETSSHSCSNCWPLKVEASNGGKTEGTLGEEKSFSGHPSQKSAPQLSLTPIVLAWTSSQSPVHLTAHLV